MMVVLAVAILSLFFEVKFLIPQRWESLFELVYLNIGLVVQENLGRLGNKYFPFVINIFLFIVILNVLGLFPYVFAITAQIVITFGLSLSILTAVTISGLRRFRLDFLSILMPGGVPLVLAPFLVVIETTSYLIRAISLGVRLAANISAGHLLLAILSGFVFNMGFIVLSIFPILILVFIILLEMMVAIIQAYVFCLLTAIYLGDSVVLH